MCHSHDGIRNSNKVCMRPSGFAPLQSSYPAGACVNVPLMPPLRLRLPSRWSCRAAAPRVQAGPCVRQHQEWAPGGRNAGWALLGCGAVPWLGGSPVLGRALSHLCSSFRRAPCGAATSLRPLQSAGGHLAAAPLPARPAPAPGEFDATPVQLATTIQLLSACPSVDILAIPSSCKPLLLLRGCKATAACYHPFLAGCGAAAAETGCRTAAVCPRGGAHPHPGCGRRRLRCAKWCLGGVLFLW